MARRFFDIGSFEIIPCERGALSIRITMIFFQIIHFCQHRVIYKAANLWPALSLFLAKESRVERITSARISWQEKGNWHWKSYPGTHWRYASVFFLFKVPRQTYHLQSRKHPCLQLLEGVSLCCSLLNRPSKDFSFLIALELHTSSDLPSSWDG